MESSDTSGNFDDEIEGSDGVDEGEVWSEYEGDAVSNPVEEYQSVEVNQPSLLEERQMVEVNEDVTVMEGDEMGYLTPTKAVVVREDVEEGAIPAPAVGMLFPSMDDVEQYFLAYANQCGFGILRSSGATIRGGGDRRNTVWTCESFGHPRKPKPKLKLKGVKMATDSIMHDDVGVLKRKSKKCGCPVKLYAGVIESGQWEIRKAIMEHSGHQFTPGKARKIARNRRNALVKNNHLVKRLFDDRKSRVPVNKIYRCMARSRNGVGEMPFTAKDMHHEVAKRRRLILAKGDAVAMFEYFAKMTSHNQNFFHMHRLDGHGRLKDVLWVDARSRVAYEEFGDVVCFDSTYMTNEYHLPFSNFVGVNHHGQSILLGCALLSRETTETFEWVFKTWLLCMGGKKPIGILTDQDPAMRRALRNTMEGTCHRWCIWHILSKFGAKLGKYEKYLEFKDELEHVIYGSLDDDEFVQNWTSVIDQYNLQDDEWLTGLYNERDMWVPAYLKHLFWAGMKTTQRVESMNSFFDGYVDKHTRLYEFVERYIEAMEARADAEKDADDNCARFVRQILYDFPQEKIFQQLYTDAKFKEVQKECGCLLFLNGEKKQVSENLWEHIVEDRVWIKVKNSTKEIPIRKKRWYKVIFDSVTNEVSCACKHFECHGIMCRHMLKVYDMHDVVDVPEKFILRRWRKDIPRKHTRVKVAYHDPTKTEVVCRYDRMMVMVDPICSKASLYKEATTLVTEALQLIDIQVDEKVSMIEKTKSEAQRHSTLATPTGGHAKGSGENQTPPSVTQKRRLNLSDSQTDSHMPRTGDPYESGLESGAGSNLNVLDPIVPPKKAHRTSDLRLRSCYELSLKDQAARQRKADAERRKAERERAKIEKQKAAYLRRLEIEQRRLQKQQEVEMRRAEKEKSVQMKKEAREKAALEKRLERERVQSLKKQVKGNRNNKPSPISQQEILLQECEQQTLMTPLMLNRETGTGTAAAYLSTGGIQLADVTGVISYFTTTPTVVSQSSMDQQLTNLPQQSLVEATYQRSQLIVDENNVSATQPLKHSD